MKTKFIFGILVLGILMTSFVSAGLFNNFGAKITGNVVSEGWTQWYDTDNPSGSGDYELLSSLKKSYDICGGLSVSKIECQTVGGLDFTLTGQKVSCDKNVGFSCGNANNGGSFITAPCQDYKVRFYCGSSTDSTCTDSDGGDVIMTKGTCTDNLGSFTDGCSSDYFSVYETQCGVGDVCKNNLVPCPSGYKCSDGACVSSTQKSSCNSEGVCTLYEGQIVNPVFNSKVYDVEINYLTSTGVKLSIENGVTNVLSEGSTWKLSDGSYLVIKDIQFDSSSNGISSVVFKIQSSTTNEVTYQGVLDMLSKCIWKSTTQLGNKTISTICSSGTICIDGLTVTSSEGINVMPVTCNSAVSNSDSKASTQYFARCCSA